MSDNLFYVFFQFTTGVAVGVSTAFVSILTTQYRISAEVGFADTKYAITTLQHKGKSFESVCG